MDDLKHKGPQDRNKINMHEENKVKYWTKELGVSNEKLQIRSGIRPATFGAGAARFMRANESLGRWILFREGCPFRERQRLAQTVRSAPSDGRFGFASLEKLRRRRCYPPLIR
jgi:hypothetical protein